MKKIFVVAAPLALAACGGPVELSVAKLAGDLISYVTTGKSTTDHAVSAAADGDCALHRPLFKENVCKDEDTLLAERASALAVMGEPEVKQELRMAHPEIYAVNAPAEDWSRPSPAVLPSKTIITTDLPPRAVEAKANSADKADETVAAVEVASVSDDLPARDVAPSVVGNDPINAEAVANAAIAGYVPEDTDTETKASADVADKDLADHTKTAALVDGTVMSDNVDRVTTDQKADQAMAGDDLGAPLPGNYVILASFSEQARAQNALTLYEEYQPRLISAKVKGREYLRVAVGPLSSDHARDLRLLAAKKGIQNPWIVGIAPIGE